MDKRPAEQAFPSPGLVGQCVRAAAVGGVLGLAVTVVALTVAHGELEALGELAVAVLAAWVLSWPLLLLARVRRPLLTALLAPVAVVALTAGAIMLAPYAPVPAPGRQTATVIAAVAVTAGGYAVAAFVGGPGARPRWRVVVAVVVVALIPAQLVVAPIQRAAREADGKAARLTAFPRPLFAPDLPGYTITEFRVDDSLFAFWLRPKAAAVGSPTIAVFQTPAPPRFDPPAGCVIRDAGNATCTPVGLDVWRVAKPPNGWASLYLARRGDQVIEIGAGSAAIPENDVLRAATTLRPQAPSHFLG